MGRNLEIGFENKHIQGSVRKTLLIKNTQHGLQLYAQQLSLYSKHLTKLGFFLTQKYYQNLCPVLIRILQLSKSLVISYCKRSLSLQLNLFYLTQHFQHQNSATSASNDHEIAKYPKRKVTKKISYKEDDIEDEDHFLCEYCTLILWRDSKLSR